MTNAMNNTNACRDMETCGSRTVMPPDNLEQLRDLDKYLQGLPEDAALVGPDGQTVTLPREIFEVLREVAVAMQAGKAITVAPVGQLLTTQQAADFLGISRPTLVKLLEEGEIPFERTTGGRHRRIRLDDVLRYQSRKREKNRNALRELTAEASSHGLYDQDMETYREALAQARKEVAESRRR